MMINQGMIVIQYVLPSVNQRMINYVLPLVNHGMINVCNFFRLNHG